MQALNLLFKYYGLDSMDKHKKSIDEAKLALERKIAEQKMPEASENTGMPQVMIYLPDNGRDKLPADGEGGGTDGTDNN